MSKRIVKFEIYRYDPDKDERPYMQKLEVELQPTDKMLLDAIVRIKNDVDDSLSIRLDVDEKGRIKAQLAQSSGCKRVDDQFVSAVRNARIEVLRVNGIATSFYTTQIFSLKLKNSEN